MSHVSSSRNLEIKEISKHFGTTLANDKVSILFKSGSIHAIVGQNGAGKSTLVKILFGAEQADSGSIWLSGNEIKFYSPRQALSAGIGLVAQEFTLIDELDALENLILGNEPLKRGFLSRKEALAEIELIQHNLGIEIPWNAKVSTLSVPQKQQLEILRLLNRGAEILIFDEPTAALAPLQVKGLLDIFLRLKSEGKTLIFISHKLNEVFEIADEISILRNGKLIANLDRNSTNQKYVSELMLGRSLTVSKQEKNSVGSEILSVTNMNIHNFAGNLKVENLCVKFKRHAISGICGVTGNGQEEFIEAIAGMHKVEDGEVSLEGLDITSNSVAERGRRGLGYIPADRKTKGLAQIATIEENLIASFQHQISNLGIMRKNRIMSHVEKILKEFKVTYANSKLAVSTLSGGNQQKLMIGRVIAHGPKVLIASQPTRGIDIGGTQDIHNLLTAQRDGGVAVILHSEDIDELLKLCDEIFVFYRGKIVKSFESPFERNRIGNAMVGILDD